MKLGFCGLGLMGAAMVRQLLAAGHEVRVWNRSPEKCTPFAALGAKIARTPREAAANADGVLLCLFDAAAVESVVFGDDGIATATGFPWLVDHSTIPPDSSRKLRQRLLQQSGAEWVDAPVSGGIDGADRGELTVMAGGAAQPLALAVPAMRAYASNVTHVGDCGAGQAAKLCNQTIVATTIAAIGEAVGLAQRNGIDVERLGEALQGGWADSRLLQVFLPRMINPPKESIGALKTMLKDVDSVGSTAQISGVPMPVTAAVQNLLRLAAAQGLADAELSSVVAMSWPEQRDRFLSGQQE